MNKNSEVPLVMADAFVMYYDNTLGKWMASGGSNSVTIAKVQILQNLVSNQFRIFAWNPINKEVLLTSILYHNLRYQKAHATFHEWRDADTQLVYGIHFADTKEANVFGDVISKIFSSLETIYKQCKELQETIHSQSEFKKIISNTSPRKISPGNNPTENNSTNVYNRSNLSSPQKQVTQNLQKAIVNSTEDCTNLPTYENINVLLGKSSYQCSSSIKTLTTGSEITELNNRCQSSSDDSVRGLKRQPSSSASSGYATVASVMDQYSPITGKGNSGGLPNSVSYSTSVVETTAVLPSTEKINPEEVVQTSFASQLQSAIQLRKKSSSTNICSTKSESGGSHSGLTSPTKQQPYNRSTSSNTSTPKPPQAPIDDIMSEMKRKLERRKQLIDGHHTDTNYSSSDASDKSDGCSSPVEYRSREKLPSTTPNSASVSRSVSTRFSETSSDNKTIMDEDKCQGPDDITKDKTGAINHKPHIQKKQHAGDYTQTSSLFSSGQTNVTVTKNDLSILKNDIIDSFRKELSEIKKDIINAIFTSRAVRFS